MGSLFNPDSYITDYWLLITGYWSLLGYSNGALRPSSLSPLKPPDLTTSRYLTGSSGIRVKRVLYLLVILSTSFLSAQAPRRISGLKPFHPKRFRAKDRQIGGSPRIPKEPSYSLLANTSCDLHPSLSKLLSYFFALPFRRQVYQAKFITRHAGYYLKKNHLSSNKPLF